MKKILMVAVAVCAMACSAQVVAVKPVVCNGQMVQPMSSTTERVPIHTVNDKKANNKRLSQKRKDAIRNLAFTDKKLGGSSCQKCKGKGVIVQMTSITSVFESRCESCLGTGKVLAPKKVK